MGCWEAGARSRMLNLRCPNAIPPCAKTPAASGPLACIELVIFDKHASDTPPSLPLRKSAHTATQNSKRPTSGACDNPIDNARFHLRRGKIQTRASPGEVIIAAAKLGFRVELLVHACAIKSVYADMIHRQTLEP